MKFDCWVYRISPGIEHRAHDQEHVALNLRDKKLVSLKPIWGFLKNRIDNIL